MRWANDRSRRRRAPRGLRLAPIATAAVAAGAALAAALPWRHATAADRHWVGPETGGWSNNANWSATPGGPGGASFPVGGADYAGILSPNNVMVFDPAAGAVSCGSIEIGSTIDNTMTL